MWTAIRFLGAVLVRTPADDGTQQQEGGGDGAAPAAPVVNPPPQPALAQGGWSPVPPPPPGADGRARHRFRRPLPGRGHHLFLVVGETGSGKSTFLNVMANYHRGGSYPEDVKVIIPSKVFPVTEHDLAPRSSESGTDDQSKSQTTKAIRYTFAGEHNFVFIDTPGFGDTEGIEKDDAHVDTVLEAAADAGELHGVVLVVNGTTPRFTPQLHYVLTKLRCNLPDVVMNNFVVVMTMCTELSSTFPQEKLKDFKPKSIRYMDNAFFHKDPKVLSANALAEAQTKWEQSMRTFAELEVELCGLHSTSTEHFKVLREGRFEIKQQFHGLRGEVERLQVVYDALQAEKAKASSFGQTAQGFSNYTQTTKVKVPVTKSTGVKNTTCSDCSHVCHANCSLQETTSTGSSVFRGCWAMSGDNCGQCPKRCHHTRHYHSGSTTTYEEQTISQVLQDVKAKYDSALADQQRANQQATTLEGTIATLEKAQTAAVTKITTKMQEVRKVASHFNLVHEMKADVDCLKRVGQGLTSVQARAKHDTIVSSIEGTLKRLQPGSA